MSPHASRTATEIIDNRSIGAVRTYQTESS
jgi:hypothetical protein